MPTLTRTSTPAQRAHQSLGTLLQLLLAVSCTWFAFSVLSDVADGRLQVDVHYPSAVVEPAVLDCVPATGLTGDGGEVTFERVSGQDPLVDLNGEDTCRQLSEPADTIRIAETVTFPVWLAAWLPVLAAFAVLAAAPVLPLRLLGRIDPLAPFDRAGEVVATLRRLQALSVAGPVATFAAGGVVLAASELTGKELDPALGFPFLAALFGGIAFYVLHIIIQVFAAGGELTAEAEGVV